MLDFIIASSFFNPFTPYLRKHILTSLDPHDYLFLNILIIQYYIRYWERF
jgi:hypothetical protein